MMMSSLYKTVSFFRPPRRPDRSAGVTVRRRRSVRRLGGPSGGGDPNGPDGGPAGPDGGPARPNRRDRRGRSRRRRKKGRVSAETSSPPPICFMKRDRWEPATPLLSPPPFVTRSPLPPTPLCALLLCFLTPRSCPPRPNEENLV